MGQGPPPSARASVAARSELVPGRLIQLDLSAPKVAAASRPGHFVIIQATARSQRVSLPVADLEPAAGRLSVVVGAETPGFAGLAALKRGSEPAALLGPIGRPSPVEGAASVLLVGEGPPAFGLIPVARAMGAAGSRLCCLVAGEPECARLLEERLGSVGAKVAGPPGNGSLAGRLEAQVKAQNPALILAAGPVPLLRAVQKFSGEQGVKARLRLNPAMLDGVGLCGGCRVKIDGKLALCCLEGVEFEAPGVDFDYLERRECACRAS